MYFFKTFALQLFLTGLVVTAADAQLQTPKCQPDGAICDAGKSLGTLCQVKCCSGQGHRTSKRQPYRCASLDITTSRRLKDDSVNDSSDSGDSDRNSGLKHALKNNPEEDGSTSRDSKDTNARSVDLRAKQKRSKESPRKTKSKGKGKSKSSKSSKSKGKGAKSKGQGGSSHSFKNSKEDNGSGSGKEPSSCLADGESCARTKASGWSAHASCSVSCCSGQYQISRMDSWRCASSGSTGDGSSDSDDNDSRIRKFKNNSEEDGSESGYTGDSNSADGDTDPDSSGSLKFKNNSEDDGSDSGEESAHCLADGESCAARERHAWTALSYCAHHCCSGKAHQRSRMHPWTCGSGFSRNGGAGSRRLQSDSAADEEPTKLNSNASIRGAKTNPAGDLEEE